MGLAVVTVASGGLPVGDNTAKGVGMAVTEATYGIAVTKVTGGGGLGVVYVTATGGAVASFATFDGVPLTVTLSNGNLTAIRSNTATAAAGARSSVSRNSGKYYYEVTVGATHGLQDCVAIATPAQTYAQILAGQAAIVAFTSNAPIWINGSASGKTLGSNIVAGDVVGAAIDLGAALVWFRKNNGLWNGTAGADPATGVGGVAGTPGGSAGPAIAFGGTGSLTNDAMTANFGQSAYAFAVPSGFGKWPAS